MCGRGSPHTEERGEDVQVMVFQFMKQFVCLEDPPLTQGDGISPKHSHYLILVYMYSAHPEFPSFALRSHLLIQILRNKEKKKKGWNVCEAAYKKGTNKAHEALVKYSY